MSFWYYEGTKDFVVTTPALIMTFEASGSITAGRGVTFDTGDQSKVEQATCAKCEKIPVGVALKSASDGDPVPVLVWGVAKNLTSIGEAKTPGMLISLSGSGYFADCTSLVTDTGTSGSAYVAGKVISGSGGVATGKFMAFIDCMK